jgi:hypothetical protein
MTLTKKLLLLSLSCIVFVFGIVFFETAITLWLSDKPELFTKVVSWMLGVSMFTGALIPFGMLAVTLSNWYEKTRDASSIYGKNDRG